ncbi:GNAT family N-acetyltransferase [Agromyces aerolatus]|uniref:GNAT family N-acetyltransferase n=1 Tax=Agromyces sp. LY-1074 TaxID=3074080 RepID=UPI002861F95D|nr:MULTISPECIES: GNAT family N-acetyltransferase [unclassified Agromyces]MDR5700902.1 GNAT family N-acetyltransferase [Agromyces sp. LY-1074]MDR5707437.1 GNAT family N-acetyltransferase [Agromyces sp. LY-1358]
MGEGFVMRRMLRSELDLVVRWAAAEGWNPGVHDAEAFYAADPEGFFVGVVDGEVVASISVVRYDPSYAFLGFYLVRPDQRGKGYGFRLWSHALEHTRATTIGLDGVVAQIPAYERAGFRTAYRSVRYVTNSSPGRVSPSVRPVEHGDVARVLEFDRDVFGVDRAGFVRDWLSRTGVHAELTERGGAVVGYGAIRPATTGVRIGPLFAESSQIADELLSALLAMVPSGTQVAIDLPESNPHAAPLALVRHMTAEFETVRMYAGGPPPPARTDRIFGVTSFELG